MTRDRERKNSVPHALRSTVAPNALRNHDPLWICSRRSRFDQCQSLLQMQQQMKKDEQEEIFATKPLIDLITPLVQRHIEEEKEEELLKAMSMEDATPKVSNDL